MRTIKSNPIEILIISNKLDFTTDYVCLELYKRDAKYFRLNRDEFANYNIYFDVLNSVLTVETQSTSIIIDSKTLKSIYYRAPIYLRDIYVPNIPPEEQLYRTQWTAFIRNLTVFEDVIWVNNPISTFRAENKLLQLKYANKINFPCPITFVTNSNNLMLEDDKYYIAKSLDTAILRIGEKEAFVYSNKLTGAEIKSSSLRLAPIVLQNYIFPKIDVRVTVIGRKVFSVRILKDDKGLDGDWRKEKENVRFVAFNLPIDIEKNCVELVETIGLSFGAIDLIESNGQFYFIEINPTGEWAWLVEIANQRIDLGICDYLEGKDG